VKVAIVRGNRLNRFEMQSYEPMASRHELTGYASYHDTFELQDIGFSVKRLHSADEYYSFLPSSAKGILYGLSRGTNNRLIGLEKELEDKDIIQGLESSNGFSYQAARVRKEKNKRLVLTVWENIPFQSMKPFRACGCLPGYLRHACCRVTNNKHIVRYIKENTDMFIAVTERAAKALIIEGTPEEKIRVIPAGIDINRFKPGNADPGVRNKIGVSDGDYVVLFVGRLTREKGIYDLLHAAKLMASEKEPGNIKIVMAGQGAERYNILRAIRSLGIESIVSVAGGFSYRDMPDLYKAVDAFVLPSIPLSWWQEQFGMVLVEAMASGLPVISTLSGSIPEVVGDAGMLVQPNDPMSILQAVQRLARDPAEQAKYSRLGRSRAMEMFDMAIVSKQIESVYNEIV
jgi:glycosyltransferase involved in cell wall biosynthesis